LTHTVLYHANCADGFGAAWAAWHKLGDEATYRPVRHGVPAPVLPEGSSVYILDFCYSREVIVAMRKRFAELQIIDHHRTAEEALKGLDYAVFDNSKSGAVLAWEHFHPEEPVPLLLRYVMEHDLWRYELPQSREVYSALSSYPMDFEVWNGLEVSELAKEGVPIHRYKKEQVALLCDQARFEELAGYRVPIVNAAVLGSEVGEELLRRYPEARFVVIYFDRGDGIRQWSLRSREDFDVSEIARQFQNGGHRQAAGFETRLGRNFVPKAQPSARPFGKKKSSRRK
jgi:hypothetical protein